MAVQSQHKTAIVAGLAEPENAFAFLMQDPLVRKFFDGLAALEKWV